MKRVLAILTILVAGGAIWYFGFHTTKFGGSSNPQTSATYAFDDWVVFCALRDQGLPCEMNQQLVNGKTGGVITKISMVYAPEVDKHALQILVPLGTSLEPGLAIQIGGSSASELTFSRCVPQGCLAAALIDDALLMAMKSGDEGKLILVDRARNQVALPFSLKGFDNAERKLRHQTESLTGKGFSLSGTVDQVEKWFGEIRNSDEESTSVDEAATVGEGE
ncbi:MAG: invasion associated locus B family protein [Alphaproteobacteria bacterium]|nr:MAG: invasion associated locus B family protein [Alphaproteobacteria bacterium]